MCLHELRLASVEHTYIVANDVTTPYNTVDAVP